MKIIDSIRKSDTKRFIISLGLFIAAMVWFLPLMKHYTIILSGTTHFPDTDMWYSALDLKIISGLYDVRGGLGYAFTRFTFDLIWPLIYYFFLSSSLNLAMKGFNSLSLKKIYKLIPLLAVVFDITENTLCSVHFIGLKLDQIAVAASISSGLKWIFIFISFALIIFHLIIWIVNLLIRKYKKT